MAGLIPPGFRDRVTRPGFSSEKPEGSFSIERAYDYAKKIIEQGSINPIKLGSPYNERDARADSQFAKEKKLRLEREANDNERESIKLAKALEVAIHELINDGWLGSEIHSALASEYDDIQNKIDLIAEMDIKGTGATAHAALGIDITYAQDLRRKIDLIRANIQADKLATVKYYKSRDGHMTGSLNNIPRLVLGADEQRAKILVKAWYERNPAIKQDPIKEMILTEAMDQCEAFEAYARRIGALKAAQSYKRTGDILRSIRPKNDSLDNREGFLKDRVFKELQILINQLD